MNHLQVPVNRWVSIGTVAAALWWVGDAFAVDRSLHDPTPTGGDEFGSFGAIAVDGKHVLIGARFDNTHGFSVGQAHLFDAATGELLQSYDDPTPTQQDFFGNSVDLDGERVVIGANRDDSLGMDVGQAHLFDTLTGKLLRNFNDPTPTHGDWFGRSVAIDTNRVLIGARHDDTLGVDAGQAHLFDADTGMLLHTFNDPTPTPQGFFGHWVALDGNRALISALGDDEAHLFDADTGHLLRTFNNPTPRSGDRFGIAVAIEGDRVLVGNTGAAHLFDASTGDLLHTIEDPAPDSYGRFGWSVALDGNLVLIGAVGDMFSPSLGNAHLFDAVSGDLLHTFDQPHGADFARFGESVALDGNTVLVGAPYDNTLGRYVGQVHLFSAPDLSVVVNIGPQDSNN